MQSRPRAIDAASFAKVFNEAPLAGRATLLSECQSGARDFLTAVPNQHLGTAMDPAEFTTSLRTRLGSTVAREDGWCPLCDSVLDTKGYHANVCCAGGDRTTRHNKVRNAVFKLAKAAALGPELEKPNLLLPSNPDDAETNRRRPADVFLPAWLNGSPAALDFAVTAPQRQVTVEQAAKEALASAKQYSQTKREYLNTAQLCADAGVEFVPMVCESTGAWAPEALHVLGQLAQAAALQSGRDKNSVFAETLQVLSVTVRRCQARALLRRLA